jgi:hypothetical protein
MTKLIAAFQNSANAPKNGEAGTMDGLCSVAHYGQLDDETKEEKHHRSNVP